MTHLLSLGLAALEPLDGDRPRLGVDAGHDGRVDPTCRRRKKECVRGTIWGGMNPIMGPSINDIHTRGGLHKIALINYRSVATVQIAYGAT